MFQQSFSQLRPEHPGSTNQATLLAYQNIQQRGYENQGKIDKIDDLFSALNVDETFSTELSNIKSDVNSDIDEQLKTTHLSNIGDFITNVTRDIKNDDRLKSMVISSENIRKLDEDIVNKPEIYQQLYFNKKRGALLKDNRLFSSDKAKEELYSVPDKKDIQAELHQHISRFIKPNDISTVRNKLFFNKKAIGIDAQGNTIYDENYLPLANMVIPDEYLTSSFFSDYGETLTDKRVTYGDLDRLLRTQIFGEKGESPTELGVYFNKLAEYESELTGVNITGRDILKANTRGLKTGLEYRQSVIEQTERTIAELLSYNTKLTNSNNTENPQTPVNQTITPPYNVTRKSEIPTDYNSYKQLETNTIQHITGLLSHFPDEEGALEALQIITNYFDNDYITEQSDGKFKEAYDKLNALEANIPPYIIDEFHSLHIRKQIFSKSLDSAIVTISDNESKFGLKQNTKRVFDNLDHVLGTGTTHTYHPTSGGINVQISHPNPKAIEKELAYIYSQIGDITRQDILNEVEVLSSDYLAQLDLQDITETEKLNMLHSYLNDLIDYPNKDNYTNEFIFANPPIKVTALNKLEGTFLEALRSFNLNYNTDKLGFKVITDEVRQIVNVQQEMLRQKRDNTIVTSDKDFIEIMRVDNANDVSSLKKYILSYTTTVENTVKDENQPLVGPTKTSDGELATRVTYGVSNKGQLTKTENDINLEGLTYYNGKLHIAYRIITKSKNEETQSDVLVIPTDMQDNYTGSAHKLSFTDNLKHVYLADEKRTLNKELETIYGKEGKAIISIAPGFNVKVLSVPNPDVEKRKTDPLVYQVYRYGAITPIETFSQLYDVSNYIMHTRHSSR